MKSGLLKGICLIVLLSAFAWGLEHDRNTAQPVSSEAHFYGIWLKSYDDTSPPASDGQSVGISKFWGVPQFNAF
ncbi:hypothetical protein ACR6HW_09825 [Fusibacter sp. JL298sf-3]